MTYFAIFFLNAGLTVPIVFFSVGLPTVMREAGLPLELIGLTAVVYLPYALAFLWAPFVDRRSLNGLGLRRSWLFVVPCLMAMVSVLGAAVPPEDSAFGVLGIAFLVTFLGATARTALLGYVTENVSPDRRPWGAVILPAGGAVGAFIGASGLLFLHSQTNWRSTMLIAAAIIALSAVTALAASERNPPRAGEGHTPPSLRRFFSRSDARRVLGFIAPLGVGMGLVFGMLQPQLVDIGFTLEGIGLINGVFICAALFTGGPLAAYLTGPLRSRHASAVRARRGLCGPSLCGRRESLGVRSAVQRLGRDAFLSLHQLRQRGDQYPVYEPGLLRVRRGPTSQPSFAPTGLRHWLA